ncbi:tRNA uridine-5-carboxymethylaminomethyl(34) synthesis GTPase MnmE [Garciella nitratireducens]|uniref:tRNA uridine-5-carboxymethylaminomethyl(34) synthesis GTPase MnmE n=1 Tax=Garciella nitratireducens TaxID=218205 RepID=UPI000DEBE11C|nr:tRNA uridine-5-carboxymethylaminomethyl(34) synthesis GTPase MnmE [Garciella nitratireducens]RBP36689.1 tRNA modification GTPase trmE [Garciella nitratireducens]
MYEGDTIAAISTAPGEAGIGIVRMSGSEAFEITQKIFQSSSGKSFSELRNRGIHHGFIIDPKTHEKMDEVLVSKMKAPHTYTTEDVVEVNCHGGMIAVRRILELLLRNGARLAEPGEFTKRAFLNGRMDLSQAEAVIDLIRAKTDKGMDIALEQLEGSLSHKVQEMRESIIHMLAHIEASIDYPEYDIEEVTYDTLLKDAKQIKEKIEKLLETSDTGKILREGLNTVIIGKPNVGKSSLLNALVKEGRAIVTDVPGTTRDIIEEYINIRGVPLKIIDTAGIRETEDVVEKIGVDKSRELIEKSDLILFLLDVSKELSKEDELLIDLVQNKKAIILFNKIDLDPKVSIEKLKDKFPKKSIIEISALKGEGVERLQNEIVQMVYGGRVSIEKDGLVSNVRHKNLLEKALNSITITIDTIQQGLPLELISVDLKDCWDYLGQVTGDTVSEDIIDQIFSNFCIGK